MAIYGHVVLEDHKITFRVTPENNVTYTVRDALTRASESRTVDGASFMCALGLALQWDGEMPSDAHRRANSVMPSNPRLRFIP